MAVLGEKATDTLSRLKDPMIIEEVLFQLDQIKEIGKIKQLLQNEFSQRIISTSEIAKKKEEMTQKELKAKEKAVLSVHPNQITKCEINCQGGKKTRYQTRLQGKRPRFASYEDLIQYLYEFYFDETLVKHDYSVNTIFEEALANKMQTEDSKEKTIRDYLNSYKAFITEEFAQRDIRTITPTDMKGYIQSVIHQQEKSHGNKIPIKRFYKFKGLLNLIFDYATDAERMYISINPVPQHNNIFKKSISYLTPKPEEKAFQPEELERIREYLWSRVSKYKYDYNGYAILFSMETGVRIGEIPSLKWSDVSDTRIHIHSQQNDEMRGGKKCYYYNPTTKNEKGVSNNGRYIPITNTVRKILDEIKEKQEELGTHPEWVFAKANGEWITTAGFYEALHKISKKLGLSLSNNHAFRMALNSYVLVPMDIPVSERAKLLGHSVTTNLEKYTFARSDEYLDEICDKWNSFNEAK